MMKLFWRVYAWFWNFLPDHCEICHGKKGGVRGNENRLPAANDPRGYVVACDYCHVEHRLQDPDAVFVGPEIDQAQAILRERAP